MAGRLEVLIEVDVGMRRGGVRSAAEAVALAQHVSTLPGLHSAASRDMKGTACWNRTGTCESPRPRQAMDQLEEAVETFDVRASRSEVVSMGGTGTYDITGADPRVTEIQAGSYVFMDMFHGNLVPGFSRALTVLGTVVTQHGHTIVLDAGRKSIGIDFVPPDDGPLSLLPGPLLCRGARACLMWTNAAGSNSARPSSWCRDMPRARPTCTTRITWWRAAS